MKFLNNKNKGYVSKPAQVLALVEINYYYQKY